MRRDFLRELVEQVVEVDAAFVDRYLNDGDVEPRELHAPLEEALRQGHLIPICFVSARNGAGVNAGAVVLCGRYASRRT